MIFKHDDNAEINSRTEAFGLDQEFEVTKKYMNDEMNVMEAKLDTKLDELQRALDRLPNYVLGQKPIETTKQDAGRQEEQNRQPKTTHWHAEEVEQQSFDGKKKKWNCFLKKRLSVKTRNSKLRMLLKGKEKTNQPLIKDHYKDIAPYSKGEDFLSNLYKKTEVTTLP